LKDKALSSLREKKSEREKVYILQRKMIRFYCKKCTN